VNARWRRAVRQRHREWRRTRMDFFVSGSADSDGYPSVSGSPRLARRRRRHGPTAIVVADLSPAQRSHGQRRVWLRRVPCTVRSGFRRTRSRTRTTDTPTGPSSNVDNVDGVSATWRRTTRRMDPSACALAYLYRLNKRSRFDDSTYSHGRSHGQGNVHERMHTQLTGAAMQMAVRPGPGTFTLGLGGT
jgi:hypothetical protein